MHAQNVGASYVQAQNANERRDSGTMQQPMSFDYPAVPVPDIKIVSRTVREGVSLEDFSFVAPSGRRINAYLITPPGKGPFPAILYLHWLGDPATSNRNEFLPEALAFARENVVSLLIDGLWFDEKAFPWTGRDALRDRQQCVRATVEARRALDVLLGHTEVDPQRLAVVGHDFGAMTAAQLAGVDPRVHFSVLIAGTPRYHYWFFRFSELSEAQRPAYMAAMAEVDPATLIAKAKNAQFLFQFSRGHDEWVPDKDAQEFYDVAPGEKQILWYDDADHAMKSPKALEDRINWLRLRLSPRASGPPK